MAVSATKTMGQHQKARRRAGIFLTLPALLVMAATVLYPILWSLKISLYKSEGVMSTGAFVGLKNYMKVLQNPNFQHALWNTLAFVACTIVIELIIGFAVALVLNRNLPGSKVFRVLFTLPLMIAPVIAGLQWRWLFADQYGAVNNLLAVFGIDGPLWMGTVWGARAAVLISNVWLAVPFVILILLAAMSSLSEDLYEAARLDGANAVQIFWKITLPLLKPAILMILVVRLSDAFRVFDIVYILTGGGPGGSTEVLSTYIYKTTFTGQHYGTGAAASFIVMLILMVVSFILFKTLRPKEEGK
jgi:multiple sugar transport system permease protein